jgi:hypothetical protein
MPKYVLDSGYDYDFSLLAISSPEPDYKLGIHINRLLNIELSREPSIELSPKGTRSVLVFSCFLFEEHEEESRYLLIANRSSNAMSLKRTEEPSLFEDEPADVKGMLIPELPKADYLLIIQATGHEELARELQAQLKKLSFVQTVQAIDPETLPSKKNLIL